MARFITYPQFGTLTFTLNKPHVQTFIYGSLIPVATVKLQCLERERFAQPSRHINTMEFI